MEENIEKEEPIKDNSSKKIILIIVGLVLVILITLFIIRMVAARYLINHGFEDSRQTILKSINGGISNIDKSNIRNITNIPEAQEAILSTKEFVNNQINELRSSEGANIPSNLTFGDRSIFQVSTNSILISLIENLFAVLEENEYETERTHENYIAQTLDTLQVLALQTRTHQAIQRSLRSHSENYTDLNLLMKIESFATNMEVSTQQDINNVQVKEDCLDLFEEAPKESTFNQAIKSKNFLGRILLNRNLNQICQGLEIYRRKNTIKTLERSKIESNPVVLVIDKIQVNTFVRCGINSDCPYIEEVSQDLNNALR